jgi:mannose-1-phosphate guanylyltransferase
VGDGRDLGIRVRYSWEQPLLGSAGGPRHALALLPADRFWIVNGDTLTDVDLDALAAQHDRTGALVTMALVPNPRPESYGGVLVRDGWVTGFTEPGAGGPTYHFIGVQLAEAQVFAELRDGEPAESVSGVYRTLIAARGRAIGAFVSQATFRDIGTPADYLRTSLDLTRLEAHREIPGGARTRVDPGARILRTAMWDDVTVERGAELVECVVVDNVRVPAGSRYARRILMPADRVASRASDALADGLLIAPLDPIA